MRALASLFFIVATAAQAQSAEPAVPAPAPAPCSEATRTARCECAKEWKDAFASAKYPRVAAKAGIHSGQVLVSFAISSTGEATDVLIKEATHESFSDEVTRVIRKIRCNPDAQGLRVTLPFSFKLE